MANTSLVTKYIQYSKKITTLIVIFFFCVLAGAICLIAFYGLDQSQSDAIVSLVQSAGTFSIFGITTYHLNSASEKISRLTGDIRDVQNAVMNKDDDTVG